MRIVAALCWAHEPPAFLDRLIRSLGGHVDALVALDGIWQGFADEVVSSRAEYDTIRAAAAEVDLPCMIVTPERAWESQCAKRQEAWRLAVDAHDADFILVVDGDEELVFCDDALLRRSLELTDRDVMLAMETQLNHGWPYNQMPCTSQPIRHLYRAISGVEYQKVHNGIRTPDGRWLHGDATFVTVEEPLDLSALVEFAHDNHNRSPERNQQARAYRKTRAKERLESWR